MDFSTQIDPLNTGLAFLPVMFSRNQIEYVIDSVDTSLADRSGLRYYLELLVPEFAGSSQFKRLVKMPGAEKPPARGNGSVVYEGCYFQLDELLDGFLEHQKPEFGTTEMAIIPTLTMPYITTETVENNSQLLPGATRSQASRWVLKAGLSERDFVAWGNSFFTDYMSKNRPFLTWHPNGKTIGPNQPEYLHFLLNMATVPATILRRVRVHYKRPKYNGATVEVLERGALAGGQPFQVVSVPVHPAALQFRPGDVDYYEVWLTDGNRNRISEVRTYKIDYTYRSQEQWILFTNSLGGWDTLRLLGEGSETLNTERTTAEMERPAGAPADFAELRVIQIKGSRELAISTGYFEQQSQEQLLYLSELLLAKEVYLVDSRGHQALELLTSGLVIKEDNSDLQARSFTFRMATPQFNYSTMPVAPAVMARPTKWRGVGVVQILDEYGKRTGKARPLKLQKYYVDDNTTFKPLTEKPNQPGNSDYADSLPLPGVTAGSTPYPSQALTRPTTYKRTTCINGQIGDTATIIIPAGKYGSEISQDEASQRAEAEFRQLNTQAYADQFGTCTAAPELYQVATVAGHWRYRVNNPNLFDIYLNVVDTQEPAIGNTWNLQGETRPYIYPRFSTDLSFPAKPTFDYLLIIYGTPGTTLNVKVYVDGALVSNQNYLANLDGYEQLALPIRPASGNKLYIKLT